MKLNRIVIAVITVASLSLSLARGVQAEVAPSPGEMMVSNNMQLVDGACKNDFKIIYTLLPIDQQFGWYTETDADCTLRVPKLAESPDTVSVAGEVVVHAQGISGPHITPPVEVVMDVVHRVQYEYLSCPSPTGGSYSAIETGGSYGYCVRDNTEAYGGCGAVIHMDWSAGGTPWVDTAVGEASVVCTPSGMFCWIGTSTPPARYQIPEIPDIIIEVPPDAVRVARIHIQ